MDQSNKPIRYEFIDNLRFDPRNPRLPSAIDRCNETAILDWMLSDGTLIELMGSIGERGYFPGEPLLVEGKIDKDFYEVIEGNRRLAAVKLLHNPDLAPRRKKSVRAAADTSTHKPDSLPVIVYEHRDEILNYLGYRHITGVKEWDPLAKAKYLEQLRGTLEEQDPKKQHRILAKTIGSRADYVARLLTGLGIYDEIADQDFFGVKGLDEDSINFSVLTTALNYINIAEFLGLQSGSDPSLEGLDQEKLEELTDWMFVENSERRTRLGESRKLKELSAIVKNNDALTAFRQGTALTDAHLLTEAPAEAFRKAVFEARERLKSARNQVHMIDDPTQADVNTLGEIERIARLVKRAIEDELYTSTEIP